MARAGFFHQVLFDVESKEILICRYLVLYLFSWKSSLNFQFYFCFQLKFTWAHTRLQIEKLLNLQHFFYCENFQSQTWIFFYFLSCFDQFISCFRSTSIFLILSLTISRLVSFFASTLKHFCLRMFFEWITRCWYYQG